MLRDSRSRLVYLFIVINMAGANKSLVVEDVTETVEKVIENNVDSSVQPDRTERLLKFPLTRIKTIIKTDSDVNLASSDAVVLIAKATVNIEHRWALVKWTCGSSAGNLRTTKSGPCPHFNNVRLSIISSVLLRKYTEWQTVLYIK